MNVEIPTLSVMSNQAKYILSNRTIIRENASNELFKRMTDLEEINWNIDAFRVSLKEIINEGVKPTYNIIRKKMKQHVDMFIKTCEK